MTLTPRNFFASILITLLMVIFTSVPAKAWTGEWSDFSIVDLGLTRAYDINNNEQILGDVNGQPTLWDHGQLTTLPFSYAVSLNDDGVILGRDLSGRVGLWHDGELAPLGFFALPTLDNKVEVASTRYGIAAVGSGLINEDGPYLWFSRCDGSYQGGGVKLNDIGNVRSNGWRIAAATSVNDEMQIVGYGITPKGDQHAYLLNPTPIPAVLPLLFSGLFALGIYRNSVKKR